MQLIIYMNAMMDYTKRKQESGYIRQECFIFIWMIRFVNVEHENEAEDRF